MGTLRVCSVAVDDLTSYYLLRQLTLTSTGEELVTLFRTLDISYARYFILLIAVGLIRRDSFIASVMLGSTCSGLTHVFTIFEISKLLYPQ